MSPEEVGSVWLTGPASVFCVGSTRSVPVDGLVVALVVELVVESCRWPSALPDGRSAVPLACRRP